VAEQLLVLAANYLELAERGLRLHQQPLLFAQLGRTTAAAIAAGVSQLSEPLKVGFLTVLTGPLTARPTELKTLVERSRCLEIPCSRTNAE
jgi:hypothetical protein